MSANPGTRHAHPRLAPAACVVLLAACGACASTTSTAADSVPTNCGTGKNFTIGVAQWDLKEPYRAQARDDFDRLVKEYPAFKLVEKDAQGKVDQQVADVDALLAQKVDLIIMYPGDSLGLSAEVAKVHDANVPLFEVDRSTPDASKYLALLGGDNKAIATEEAKYLAQNLSDGAKVAIITGDLAADAATERQTGAHDGLKTNPGVRIVAEQTAEWRADKAQTVVEAIIKAHPDLAGIVYANDEESLGGWQALKAAGKEKQVKQVGIDGLRGAANGVQEVIDGKLIATYEYPNGVAQALEAAKKLLVDCGKVPHRTVIPTRRIDAGNAQAVMNEGEAG
jgi:ribose transport system substrate-binding protein